MTTHHSGFPAIRAAGVLLMASWAAGAVSGEEDGLPAPRLTETAWTLRVAFEDDVQKSVIDAWCRRMQAASDLLFELTEGQIHVAACSVEDKTSIGDIVILGGLAGESVIPEADAMAQACMGGTPAWTVQTAGEPDGKPGMLWGLGTVVVHELGHAVFGLPDERDNERVKGMECPDCIMGTDPAKLCDPRSHKGGVKKSCKEVISALYGGKVRFPNPQYRRGSAPPRIKFQVTDRDKRHPG